MRQFTNAQKLAILDECVKTGNVSKVAEKYDVARATIYNWQRAEKDIRRDNAHDGALRSLKESLMARGDVLKNIEEYSELLAQKGALEKRKQLLSGHVEYILWRVVGLLERHPDLDSIHPKDLSKIMGDLHSVRKELSNEPTVIVEYRNTWMERVLQVLGEFLGEDQLREFVKRMEAVEAEYEVL